MSRGIFITGTDTGVGKTIVSAAIIRALIKKGIRVGAMKPVETGCKKSAVRKENDLIPSDGMFLKEMAGMDDSIDLVTPIRFENPLAPMVASELEKIPVEINNIFDAYDVLSKKYDFMVVEGVGGLLVPIAKSSQQSAVSSQQSKKKDSKAYFVSDLIKDLELPVIVVARPALGTINHTLLTVNYALREGINVLGVIINFNNPPENSLAEKTNPDVLKELCPVPVIGTMPYISYVTKNNIEDVAARYIPVNSILTGR
ncbi:MAG: dethiobiotin synthase [Nitrospirota bacterium]